MPVRCTCNKIVCEIVGDEIIIKCHHCKRYLIIQTRGITSMTTALNELGDKTMQVDLERLPI